MTQHKPVLALDSTGRQVAVPLRVVDGLEAVATRVRVRLETIRGSWQEDRRLGLPWLDWLQDPTTSTTLIEAEIRSQLRQILEVHEVREVTATQTGDRLDIAVEFTVLQDDAATRILLTATDDEPVPGAWFVLLTPHSGPVVPR